MRATAGLFLLLLPATALAQQPGVPAPEAAQAVGPADEPRVNQLLIYGNDPCPQGTDNEIIVCARLPEGDRYRIPTSLRDNHNAPANQSWANRAIELSYAGRSGIGSCTPSGPGGMIGCFNQIVAQARAERRGQGEVNGQAMIEQAREDRMRRIGQAEAAEARDDQADQADRAAQPPAAAPQPPH